ncbi:hypothetical protein LV457_07615 [Mycobacterium sp. MYCO198283]|nr:hypothetical protein [Mycobacterium sp. MYCO198283]MCG5432159.1 hypothetical protein [Mycobacterium sp. MYCO198283]
MGDWGPAVTAGHGDVTITGDAVALTDVQLLAPIECTATVYGVGMNYWSHLEKLGQTEPQ